MNYDDKYRIALSTFFKTQRELKDKTFTEVALSLGLKPNTFYRYESGTRDMPIGVMKDLCKYYGLDFFEVFKLIDKEASK